MIAFNKAAGISNILAQNGYAVIGFDHDGLPELIDATSSLDNELIQPIFTNLVDFDSSPINEYLGYFFNEDNPKTTVFMFSSPSLSKVSVGAVYFCFNSSKRNLSVALLNGEQIVISPNSLIFINIGMVGVDIAIHQNVNLLQGVIHSSLDSLSFLPQDSQLKLQSLMNLRLTSDTFGDSFDINTFIHKGYTTSEISNELADELLSAVKMEHYVPVEQNELDKYCGYTGRYISKHSMFKPTQIKKPFENILSELNNFLAPLLERYPNPKGDNVSVFAATKGHRMDLHADNADGSPIICLVYLADEEFTPDDGGQVSSSRCFINEDTHKLGRQNLDALVSPNHGVVVFVNNSSVKFGHEVHEILSEKYRYSMVFNFAMLTNPDWHHEFDERTGEFEKSPLMLEEPK